MNSRELWYIDFIKKIDDELQKAKANFQSKVDIKAIDAVLFEFNIRDGMLDSAYDNFPSNLSNEYVQSIGMPERTRNMNMTVTRK